jgi:hypothetical protein
MGYQGVLWKDAAKEQHAVAARAQAASDYLLRVPPDCTAGHNGSAIFNISYSFEIQNG